MSRIRVIPASVNTFTHLNTNLINKRRVCGYARVSTDRDEQFTSFQAQKDYYEKFIKSNMDWSFAGLYSDEGITGTSTKNRDGFNHMIKDALNHKIDLIVTKSISRFARNTVDTLSHIRLLKEHGVEVFFEKEDIWTFNTKGEMIVTLMSSLAQEESRSISENVTWGHRNNFKNGKVYMPFAHFLGYRKGKDGKPEIVEEEAEVVRLIYYLFIEGKTYQEIGNILMNKGIKSPGGSSKWSASTVISILSNEKYKGDALLQKGFTVDFLEHKRKINEGEVEQYYVENSHPPIIDKLEWDYVQDEIARRKTIGRSYSGSKFSSRIICGCCGGIYGHKTAHSKDKYKCSVLRCNEKYKSGKHCCSPSIKEEDVENAFIKAFNELGKNKIEIIEFLEKSINSLFNIELLDKSIIDKELELSTIKESIESLIENNSRIQQDQNDYQKRYNILEKNFYAVKREYDELIKEKKDKETRLSAIKLFLSKFKEMPTFITEFDSRTWNLVLDMAIVNKDRSISFIFKNRQKITISL